MPMLQPIRFESAHAMLLAGIRRSHSLNAPGSGIARQWQEFVSLLPMPDQRGSVRYGVMCGATATSFEYLCGVEVRSFAALSLTSGRMRIAQQRYAVFVHRGAITAIAATWQAILHDWLPGNGAYVSAHKPDFERYDERFDPATGSGEVEIWISVTATPAV